MTKKITVLAIISILGVLSSGCKEDTEITTEQIKALVKSKDKQNMIDILSANGVDVGHLATNALQELVIRVTLGVLCQSRPDTDEAIMDCIDRNIKLHQHLTSPVTIIAGASAIVAEANTAKALGKGGEDMLSNVHRAQRFIPCSNELIHGGFKGSCDELFEKVMTEVEKTFVSDENQSEVK